jgi:cob(I)alamin adenosyltransferase
MGYRLSKIYTRTGDTGTTGLGDGSRTSKTGPRIVAIGEIDELNSHIGVLLAEEGLPDLIRSALIDIQHDLFDLGGEISIPGNTGMADTQVTHLENLLDRLNENLSPLKEFILPGGIRPAALCHVARAVARRAERALVSLSREETISPAGLKYLNRLSDLLFVTARFLNHQSGQGDVLWQPGKTK